MTTSLFDRRTALAAASAWALSSMAGSALAQAPGQAKPIRIVVPFAPGGGNDVFARQIAKSLAELRGHSVLVENKPGAGGNVGTELVVRSPADATTFLLGHTGTVSINPALYKQLKYDTQKDLSPVAMFASSALVLVVPASSRIKTVADLLAQAKADLGGLTFGSSGNGTGGHLSGELLEQKTGAKLRHVPYRGTAPALTDVAGGQVQLMFSVIPPAMALVQSGRLRAIAVTSPQRNPSMPDVPTMAEAGVAGFQSTLTYGLLAPRGTPEAALRELSAQVIKIAQSAEFQARLGVEGAVPLIGGPAEYAALIKRESTQWAELVKVSGATAD